MQQFQISQLPDLIEKPPRFYWIYCTHRIIFFIIAAQTTETDGDGVISCSVSSRVINSWLETGAADLSSINHQTQGRAQKC